MNTAFLLLGSNIENRSDYLSAAIQSLVENDLQMLHKSSIYESEPWGEKKQNTFLNQVVQIKTFKSPLELLMVCKQVEEKIGRKHRARWLEREIDIDILLFNEEEFQSELLTIPHPQLIKRRFALLPLSELAADKKHPVLQLSIADLLILCVDDGEVGKIE